MRKSMKHYFPRASTVVRSRHLKENVGRKLDDLIGKSSQVRQQIMAELFGTTGLIAVV
jgi:hypothetical protein